VRNKAERADKKMPQQPLQPLGETSKCDVKKAPGHYPVLLREMLQAVGPKAGEIYLDGTFGAGGYSRALLGAEECKVIAIDRDPLAETTAAELAKEYPSRFRFLKGNFGEMHELLVKAGLAKVGNEKNDVYVNAVVLDIGVSSMQIDVAERGFSFQKDGPLDMRMSGEGMTAADVVNEESEEEIARILWMYGEERLSRRIARAICRKREEAPITRTGELVAIIHEAVGGRHGKVDSATRTFQALRIRVNDELGELERALHAAEQILAPGGRLVVVTFHSLEDRMVKRFFFDRSGETGGRSRHLPLVNDEQASPAFFLPRRKAVEAQEDELAVNPRSRSAKLRVAIRTDAPAGKDLVG
jgi:16S rRNA (cytosine1402-N4)-methyltransferase